MQKISHINLSDEYLISINNVLGKGSTGSVFEARSLKSNQKVAVKIIELETIDNQVTQYLLKMQKIALTLLDNKYVLKGLKISQNKKYCFMVTEYCNGGTLKNYIKNWGRLSEQRSFEILKGLLQGYLALVQKSIVHRDLKPANIMLHNEKPKIIDFGYCEIAGYTKPTLEYNVGSPSYMAPQSYQDSIYNQKTQIWALGVILFECLTGRTIDEGRQMTQAYKQIMDLGVPYPEFVTQKSRNLINWCLELNPKKRPTCKELLSSHYFNQSSSLFSLQPNKSKTLLTRMEHFTSYYRPTTPIINYEQKALNTSRVPTRKPLNTIHNYPVMNTQRKNTKYQTNRIKPSYSNYEQNVNKVQPQSIHNIQDKKLGYDTFKNHPKLENNYLLKQKYSGSYQLGTFSNRNYELDYKNTTKNRNIGLTAMNGGLQASMKTTRYQNYKQNMMYSTTRKTSLREPSTFQYML